MISATLLAFAAVCLFVCSKLRSRGGAALFSVAVFLVLTFGVPFAELAYKCQQPHSEGCVWGRSLLPVSLAVGAVVGLVIAGGAYLMALGFQRRRRVLIEVKCGYKGLPNGMPTEEELVLGKRLEDGLDKVFGAQGMHVITRTGDAARSMLYYVENAERHAPALKVLFDSLPPLSVEIRARDEPDWETVKEVREAIK